MDAKLERIGARCATCHRQDFLPFTCPHCEVQYCLDHARVDLHSCRAAGPAIDPTARVLSPSSKAQQTQSLRALQAEHLARRQPPVNEHTARRQTSQASGQSAKARSLLATFKKSIADASASVRSSGTSLLAGGATASTDAEVNSGSVRSVAKTKPPNAAELRQIAQWKREARGDAAVPADRRVYVRVQYIDQSSADSIKAGNTTTSTVWLDREWVAGRCLDSLCRHLTISNRNATTASTDSPDRLHLIRKLDSASLEPSQRFAQVCNTAPTSARLEELVVYRGQLPFATQ